MNQRHVILLLLLLSTLNGCATPYDIGQADPRITPQDAAKDVPGMLNHTVAWGGVIAAAKNLKNKSELEIVAYPLDSSHRPDSTAPPTGRFIVIQSGYLETADYAPGRLVTVVGDVSETRRGTMGEAPYVYPIVTASKLQLWPKASSEPREPRFHFGIGVGIIR